MDKNLVGPRVKNGVTTAVVTAVVPSSQFDLDGIRLHTVPFFKTAYGTTVANGPFFAVTRRPSVVTENSTVAYKATVEKSIWRGA